MLLEYHAVIAILWHDCNMIMLCYYITVCNITKMYSFFSKFYFYLSKLPFICIVKALTMAVPPTYNVFNKNKIYYFCAVFPFDMNEHLKQTNQP